MMLQCCQQRLLPRELRWCKLAHKKPYDWTYLKATKLPDAHGGCENTVIGAIRGLPTRAHIVSCG